MSNILIIVLVFAIFLSFVPVVSISRTISNKKYRCLKFLIYSTFTWTVIIVLERVITNTSIIYVVHMLSYPTKFLLASSMLCTVYDYIEKKIPTYIIYILVSLFIGELFLSVSNNSLQLLSQISISDVNGYKDLYEASNGSLFIVHLVITYIVLVSAIVYLFIFLGKNKSLVQYKEITRTMGISSFLVLFFNMMQLLFIKGDVDLTYISLVIVVYALYSVIYRKDMIFNLKISGRGEILSNMREMYIITDSQRRIVEISRLLCTKYAINIEENIGKPLSYLFDKLKENVNFYQDIEVQTPESSNKDHLHLREKKFNLNGMKQFGYMILLYDETQVFKLLRELNKLSNYDTMTGLNNRNYIEHELANITDISGVGVVSLDLNGLKINNDYLGHERGDYLLKKLAGNIKHATSNVDKKDLARIGGDEFLIIIRDTNKEFLTQLKQSILQLCENEDLLEKVSVSIGLALELENNQSIYQLIQLADKDMYKMKQETSKAYVSEIMSYIKKLNEFIR